MAGFNNDTVFGDNFNFSGGRIPSMTQDGQLLIGDSAGNPVISTLSSGTGMTIGNAPGSITVTLTTPVAIADGGTNATSFTQGSIIFMGAAALSQDNSNFFWDDSNNMLGLGTSSPIHTLEVQGHVGIIQNATAMDQHAFEITADAANFADFKALDITYDTGSIAAGDFQAVILINVDETASTGGQNIAFNIDTTTEGSATIIGLKTGIGINAIHQETGTFGDIDDILNIAVDVTAALASGGAGNISAFVADNDTMTFGDAAQWDELEVIITTGASGGGIAPTFEFSTGGTGFSSFGPIDGTNGFRNTGIIDWEASDLSGWIANATGFFEIRITRTRNMLSTTPILDECQLTSETEHIWDASGNVNINDLICAQVTIDPGASGDSFVQFDINTTGEFRIGVDDTDDSYRISQGSALGTNDTQIITAAGEATFPLTPCFAAFMTTTQTNITGDGTQATVIFDTELFDQNADYNAATGIFTAPVTGRYSFKAGVRYVDVTAAFTWQRFLLVTSNRTWDQGYTNPGATFATSISPSSLGQQFSAYVDMDASDTASMDVNMSGGTKIIDAGGDATNISTFFTGKLAC